MSPGFAEGHARYWGETIGFDQIEYAETRDVKSEIRRLETAFGRSAEEIRAVVKRVKDLSGQDEAILDVHLMSLKDRAFKDKITAQITQGYYAEYALKKVVLDYVDLFSRMDDPYLRERSSDKGHRKEDPEKSSWTRRAGNEKIHERDGLDCL
ncbi:MAG: phosphoenolpyruvate-utilizing N-terminal domain-containing protein [Desulfobacteria bacterium]